jgi:hypothetical protein
MTRKGPIQTATGEEWAHGVFDKTCNIIYLAALNEKSRESDF